MFFPLSLPPLESLGFFFFVSEKQKNLIGWKATWASVSSLPLPMTLKKARNGFVCFTDYWRKCEDGWGYCWDHSLWHLSDASDLGRVDIACGRWNEKSLAPIHLPPRRTSAFARDPRLPRSSEGNHPGLLSISSLILHCSDDDEESNEHGIPCEFCEAVIGMNDWESHSVRVLMPGEAIVFISRFQRDCADTHCQGNQPALTLIPCEYCDELVSDGDWDQHLVGKEKSHSICREPTSNRPDRCVSLSRSAVSRIIDGISEICRGLQRKCALVLPFIRSL